MEALKKLEVQQKPNEDSHEVVKHTPICNSEIIQDSVNNQQMLQNDRVITNNENLRTTEEIVTTAEDELQDIQLKNCRKHDGLSLIRLLRFEAELLAKAKAKEEVSVCTLQSHIQEVQQNNEQVDKEILDLQAVEEKLQRELEVEQFNRSHIDNQMKNAGHIVDMLKQNYDGLEEKYKATLEDTIRMEQQKENDFQKYQARKEELQKAIKVEDEKLHELKVVFETDIKKYNSDMDAKNCTFKKLLDAEVKVTDELAAMRKKCEDMKHQFAENSKTLAEVLSRNETLRNFINAINLEELEAQKLEKQQSYEKTLSELEADLTKINKSCYTADERMAALSETLENEVKIGNELEAAYDELENEHSALLTAHEELENSHKMLDKRESDVASRRSEVAVVDSNLTKLNNEIAETVQNKTRMIDNLKIIQQKNQESQTKLADLQCQAEKLTKDYELGVPKLAENRQQLTKLQTEITNDISQLLDAKKKYFDCETLYSDQLETATKELTNAEMALEKVRQESAANIKAARDDLLAYKADTTKSREKNQEYNKQKLLEIEEQLNKVQCELKEKQTDIELLKTTIEHKQVTRHKRHLEYELLKVSSQEFPQKREENVKQLGILKSPGKPVGTKSVSWQVPSCSSFDSDMGMPSDYRKSQDELFNELLRMSPPQRLEETKPTKRVRMD